MNELTPEVLDGIEARAKEATRHPGWVVEDVDTVLPLVAAARERDRLRGSLANARATASDAIASRDKITADIMAERDEARAECERLRKAVLILTDFIDKEDKE